MAEVPPDPTPADPTATPPGGPAPGATGEPTPGGLTAATPGPDASTYRARHAAYRGLYPALAPTFHAG